MSHIRNLDIRLMTIVAALVGAVALLADWARRGMLWRSAAAGASATSGRAAAVVRIVLLRRVARRRSCSRRSSAQMLAMMVSRRREYLADAIGRRADAQPDRAGARAREDRRRRRADRRRSSGDRRTCASPIRSGRQMNLQGGFWSDLFASHPPMAARIAALKAMAFQKASD